MRAKAGGSSPEPQSRSACETRALSWASGWSPQGIETRALSRKSCAGSIGSGDEPGFGAASITAIEGRGSRSRMHSESESKRETHPADLGAGQAGPAFSGSRGRSLGPDVGEKGKERERKGKKAKESEGGARCLPFIGNRPEAWLGRGFRLTGANRRVVGSSKTRHPGASKVVLRAWFLIFQSGCYRLRQKTAPTPLPCCSND